MKVPLFLPLLLHFSAQSAISISKSQIQYHRYLYAKILTGGLKELNSDFLTQNAFTVTSENSFDLFLLDRAGLDCYFYDVFYQQRWSHHCAFLDLKENYALNTKEATIDLESKSVEYDILLVDNTPFPENGAHGWSDIKVSLEHECRINPSSTEYLENIILGSVLGALILLLIVVLIMVIRFRRKLLNLNRRQSARHSRLLNPDSGMLPSIPEEEELENVNYSLTSDPRRHSDITRAKSYKHFKKPQEDKSRFFN